MAGTLAALMVLASPASAAEPTPVEPASAATLPVEDLILPVEDLILPVEDLTFPEANLDGSVTDLGDEIVLLSDVFFDYNQDTLTPRATQELARVAEKVRAAGSQNLTIVGHTDSDGTDAANLDLSQRRAEAVRSALSALLPGVTASAQGRGEADPVADNGTDEGRALNRRVTIALG